jgi:hypothetical protein
LGATIASIVDKFIEYLDARKKSKAAPTNDEYTLKRDLAFYELIDELVDGLESILSTILWFLIAVTAGLAAVIEMSIKILIKFVHIGVAFFKLRAISKMKTKITEFYTKKLAEQKVAFESFKSKLLAKQFSNSFTLVRNFLDREFIAMETKLKEAEFLSASQKPSPTADEVNDGIMKVLYIVCETDAENCLGILRSEKFNLDLKTIQTLDKSQDKYIYMKSYWISKAAK